MVFSQQVAAFLLGGGGAAAIYTLVRAFLALRSSTDTREATAIANLERWRHEADARAEQFYSDLVFEREISIYWQRRAAEVEVTARLGGVTVPPPAPPPKREHPHGIGVPPSAVSRT